MTDPAAPTTRQLGCDYCAPCELDADHDGPHSMGMYSEWQVPTIEPMAFIHPARSTSAEALDAPTLGRAIHRVFRHGVHGPGRDDGDGDLAAAILDEYARLRSPESDR